MNPPFKPIWKKIKGKIIITSVFITGLAAFLANTETILNFFRHKGIELVDVSFHSNDSIDIKLKNAGKETSVLKTVKLDIKKKWILSPDEIFKGYLVVSKIYGIAINMQKEPPFTLTTDISQVIEPGESDRFFIHLDGDRSAGNISGDNVFLADLTILYDSKSKSVTKKNILILIKDPNAVYKETFTGKNFDLIKEIGNTSALKSKELEDLISLLNH